MSSATAAERIQLPAGPAYEIAEAIVREREREQQADAERMLEEAAS